LPIVTFTNDGKVGIGTTSPINKLEVVGNGNFTGNLYLNADWAFIKSGEDLFLKEPDHSDFVYMSIYDDQYISFWGPSGKEILKISNNGIDVMYGDLNISDSINYYNPTRIGSTTIGTPTKSVLQDTWINTDYTNTNCTWTGSCGKPAGTYPSQSCGSPSYSYADQVIIGNQTEEVTVNNCNGLSGPDPCTSTIAFRATTHTYCKGWRTSS
jgi:hypothetical protein